MQMIDSQHILRSTHSFKISEFSNENPRPMYLFLTQTHTHHYQGEWTTKKGRRSKGTDGGSDFIMAPGDSRLPGRQSGGGGRGTNRAGIYITRCNRAGVMLEGEKIFAVM